MEFFDDPTEKFVTIENKSTTMMLEHSLSSLHKWEQKWHIPYLDERIAKTEEQAIDYIKCMCINSDDFDDLTYYNLSRENAIKIAQYIKDPATATWFAKKDDEGGSSNIITSEVIYGWMVGLQIPFECQHWHLNSLLTLVKVCNENNKEPGKENKVTNKMLADRARLNAERRKMLGSTG